ncbi:MAG: hypothetical protein JW929_15210 [Anaerolineales bacterium]|nr:hypothetical protein [Anaerolineales bacterium]
MNEQMIDVLASITPNPEHSRQLMLYGQFIGSWEGKVIVHKSDGTRREESCEVYFGWVLDGRAVQDVWIAPARRDRRGGSRDAKKDIYGTTLRVYDPSNENWCIYWIEPNTNAFEKMKAKKIGDDIVQEYQSEDGTINQWCFTEITKDSFHWVGRESNDQRKTWKVRNEFFLKRQEP